MVTAKIPDEYDFTKEEFRYIQSRAYLLIGIFDDTFEVVDQLHAEWRGWAGED